MAGGSAVSRFRDTLAYPPRGMSREEAARYIDVERQIDEMVVDRRMPKPKRVDGRVIWDRVALDAAFSDLPNEPENRIDAILARRKAGSTLA